MSSRLPHPGFAPAGMGRPLGAHRMCVDRCGYPGRMRRPFIRGVALAAATFAVFACTACGTSSSAGGPPGSIGALKGKNGAQVLQLAYTAARKAGSVRIVEGENDSGTITTVRGTLGQLEGTEQFSVSKPKSINFTLTLVKGVVYMKANSAALTYAMGTTASSARTYAGRWISIISRDGGYHRAATGLTLAFLLTQVVPTGAVTEGRPTIIRGRNVVGISGSLSTLKSSIGKLTGTIYVSTSAPFLPVEARFRNASGTGRVIVSFTSWGPKLVLHAPAKSVPMSVVDPSAAKG